MDKITLDRINKALKDRWGGRPLFRVVFADDEFEMRHRAITIHDNSGNYLAEAVETARVRKYPNSRFCYVLEKDVRDQGHPVELKDWNGYEMVWDFKQPNTDEPIDPNLEVCMFITDSMMNGVKRTLQDHYDEDKKLFNKEVEQAYEMLDNESPYIATMLQNKEGIVVPDMKKVK